MWQGRTPECFDLFFSILTFLEILTEEPLTALIFFFSSCADGLSDRSSHSGQGALNCESAPQGNSELENAENKARKVKKTKEKEKKKEKGKLKVKEKKQKEGNEDPERKIKKKVGKKKKKKMK